MSVHVQTSRTPGFMHRDQQDLEVAVTQALR